MHCFFQRNSWPFRPFSVINQQTCQKRPRLSLSVSVIRPLPSLFLFFPFVCVALISISECVHVFFVSAFVVYSKYLLAETLDALISYRNGDRQILSLQAFLYLCLACSRLGLRADYLFSLIIADMPKAVHC